MQSRPNVSKSSFHLRLPKELYAIVSRILETKTWWYLQHQIDPQDAEQDEKDYGQDCCGEEQGSEEV